MKHPNGLKTTLAKLPTAHCWQLAVNFFDIHSILAWLLTRIILNTIIRHVIFTGNMIHDTIQNAVHVVTANWRHRRQPLESR